MTDSRLPSRRQFLASAACVSTAIVVPTMVPASALGRENQAAASERVAIGVIGTGGRGRHLAQAFLGQPDAQIVALCDVDQRHLNEARTLVNNHYGNGYDVASYRDYRELLEREQLDAVIVATPDHWHALPTVAAARAGLDILCEKPLANTIGESRAIVDAVEEHGRILQVGSHERSTDGCRRACELVRNGRIGKLTALRINLPDQDPHHQEAKAMEGIPEPMSVPEEFDYDFWLGHTAEAPYTERRCHFWWRFNLAYGGGEMTDRGAHVIDIGQLGADKDHTAPVEFKATGTQNADSLYDVFWDYSFEAIYEDGLKIIGGTEQPRGVRFEGEDGWIFVNLHGGELDAEPASVLEETIGEDEVQLGRSPGHERNFLDAVKSRTEPMAPVQAGHHTNVICHLLNIAMLTGQTLHWDVANEQVTNSEHANRLVWPTMRRPWTL